MQEDLKILHPRPSAIAAAMFTLRDLDVDAIVLHGPPGCNFRTSRILEDDNISVFTTAMTEYDFIFGAKNKLVNILTRLIEKYPFRRIGVVGTCASMIIGEDFKVIKREIPSDDVVIIPVEVH
ncbi:MAG: nitrogenase component 1, partial [Candidatus Methanospirareceae archaeon]